MEYTGGANVETNACNSSVVKSKTLELAENWPIRPGMFKVPVVLAEFVIQIDVESKIKLDEPAYEIKRIEKEVFLTQARYIGGTDKVFISGYIRKNIEYASKEGTSCSGICGLIKDATVHVPFQVATRVCFNGRFPRVFPNKQPDVARYYDQKRIGKNIREADRASYERFNEPVFPELEWSEVYDADIDEKGRPIGCFPNEEEFDEFIDKSVVYLGVKLLQKQQIYSGYGYDGKGYDGKGYDGKGYDGKGYDGKGYDGKGYDGKGYDGKGYDGKGYDGKGYDGKGYGGKGYDGKGYDGKGYDGKGYDEKGYFNDGGFYPSQSWNGTIWDIKRKK
ncbi:CsxC family protein [Clostridium sp. DMHC 10]|uniref:CsxC family protein n=1 Tax=Clostridium sp. DMHC 10 TaxID=747377 RepID=UPI000B094FF0|nr:hypothetical protein [Clostridium sp. DMHC 10]